MSCLFAAACVRTSGSRGSESALLLCVCGMSTNEANDQPSQAVEQQQQQQQPHEPTDAAEQVPQPQQDVENGETATEEVIVALLLVLVGVGWSVFLTTRSQSVSSNANAAHRHLLRHNRRSMTPGPSMRDQMESRTIIMP